MGLQLEGSPLTLDEEGGVVLVLLSRTDLLHTHHQIQVYEPTTTQTHTDREILLLTSLCA